ncbi:hypothetical protein [Kitasatospora sp. NPDC002965]|uniref:hypothetical protein n=1 Tax=Kitasatospora sp. NPDC002965 TaxID=3154775 RepID=UPI0033AC073F
MSTPIDDTAPGQPLLDRNGSPIGRRALVRLHDTEQGSAIALVIGREESTGRPRVAVADPRQRLWEIAVVDPGRLELTEERAQFIEAEDDGPPTDAWLILDQRGRIIGRTVGERMEDARRAAESLPVVRRTSARDGGFALHRLSAHQLTPGDRTRLESYRKDPQAPGRIRPVGKAVSVPADTASGTVKPAAGPARHAPHESERR